MVNQLLFFLLGVSFLNLAIAECPNACSAHGKCGAFDACVCYRNWMANDCSERVCQFGLAHVDSPKGDLDASGGKLSGPSVTLIPNNDVYPYGTQEQYPNMIDTAGNILDDSAHDYAECSNKGICDRNLGACTCFDGYSGSACQRAYCPTSAAGDCSGHGVCRSIKEIAALDYGNVYNLWDEKASYGCVCDGGFSGSDCSQKECKYGADPLYYDDYANVRYANFTYQFYLYGSSNTAKITGNYSLVFVDRNGEDWQTQAISIAGTCDDVTNALEALPNNVIPVNSVRCYQHPSGDQDTIIDTSVKIGGGNTVYPKFTIAFPSNPGKIPQISINTYLDGKRPTLYSGESSSTLGWHVYANGFTGEDTDYVPDLCEGVLVTLDKSSNTLIPTDAVAVKKLKTCLGDSDGNAADNVEVYNWDHGNFANPHLIKLVDATQDVALFTTDTSGNTVVVSDTATNAYNILTTYGDGEASVPFPVTTLCTNIQGTGKFCANKNPPGFYAVLYFAGDSFHLYTRGANDYASTTKFHVFTTTGYLQLVSPSSQVFSFPKDWIDPTERLHSYHNNMLYINATYVPGESTYQGSIDCASNPIGSNNSTDCLNKGDFVMFFSKAPANNPIYPNIYEVKKISLENKNPNSALPVDNPALRHQLVLDYGLNNFFDDSMGARVFKFHPPTGYNYVGQCSNRGTCDYATGLCACYPGFTSDNCGVQSALAL